MKNTKKDFATKIIILLPIYRLAKFSLNELMASLKTDKPLFYIEAKLKTPDIIISPNENEIESIVMQVADDFIQR